MAPTPPRLKILSVGGNAVSAFLSWRLSATNACDVTLVWKNGFEQVAQYGVSFKSANKALGTERFKPRQVVRSPEEAAGSSKAAFDYVVLCVKALPDVYDLAAIIESVVSPQHTCILVNTTHSLGVESFLESRFPTNVVLSLVCGAELTQMSTTEFEHTGPTDFWVGPANRNPGIPASIQTDMAEALAMTLNSGQVDCRVSPNIRQQQYERMIGPIAFYPASVLFETSNHTEMMDKSGVSALVNGVIDELLNLASAQGCSFPEDFTHTTIRSMCQPTEAPSLMYQDFAARRPMEIETFLGSPLRFAKDEGIRLPRIETLYALLHNVNIMNQRRTSPMQGHQMSPSMASGPLPPRMSSIGGPNSPSANGPPNGFAVPPGGRGMVRPGGRAASLNGVPQPMRRGPSQNNGYPPRAVDGRPLNPQYRGGMPPRSGNDGNDLEEFSHLMLYDNVPDGQTPEDVGYTDDTGAAAGMQSPSGELAMRERELALRQRELALRERELSMRQGPGMAPGMAPGLGPGPGPGPGYPPMANRSMRRRTTQNGGFDDDDDDDDGDYFDPMAAGPVAPMVDADNFDMMSVTSRRTRKAPSAQQLRNNPEMGGPQQDQRRSRNMFGRQKPMRGNGRGMADMPGLRNELMTNPMMGYSSDRYGGVDRHNMSESRTNSLTAERLQELQTGGMGPGGFPPARRASQSPGNPLNGGRPMQGRSPTAGPYENGGSRRSSPPLDMRAPVPRHPPGHGNAVAPHQVEQQVGVSTYPMKKSRAQERSLTGSASASAGSGDSNRSAPIDSEPSAHSSSSSLGPMHARAAALGVR